MSDESGFCCRCGKETDRKEQVGLIVAWICSTRCAYKARTTYARPALPELDKLNAARPFLRVMDEFFEWLTRDDPGITLVTWDHRNERWKPIEETSSQLLNLFFNIDPKKIEEEKKMLEETIVNYQKDAASRRPV